MALDTAFYLVTKEIAIRSGLVDVRYRTLDGRFILDNKDLSRVRFTTDEYVNGLDGVEKITESEARTLIAKGGYKKGLITDSSPTFANEAPIVEEANEDANEDPNEVEETSEEPTENVEEEEQASDNNEEETETNEQEKEEE